MAGVSVKFNAIDEISSKFDSIATAGEKALDTFEKVESSANSSFSSVEESVKETADAMDKVSSATDYWTDAVGNYDKSAMEAIWSTEELVAMGYKTEDALKAAADALEEAEEAAKGVGDTFKDTEESVEGAGKETEQYGKKSKEAIMSLDDVLATVGIVTALGEIADGFLACSEASAKFETNIAMLSTVADTTVLSAEELSAQITSLSSLTAKNVNELTDSTYNAISAGVDTANAVDTVSTATKLSVAGFTDTTSALSVLTTVLNAYKMEESELVNVSDSLIVSQNLGVMTIDQLASSMGKAISTASAYSVDLYNLESGYISLTKAGISAEESTTYISSMFNELGNAGSEVSKVLVDETGMSFGQLMNQGYSLADVLGILYESVNRDSEALMNLWGSAEAGKASNAIVSQGLETFNSNLLQLTNSSGITQRAYETMTNTSTYATQRLENSMTNLSIAIGDDVNPVFSKLKNGVADVVDGFTSLVTKHPAISGTLTGVSVTLGVLTLGLGGYTVAAKVATVATAAWTAVMDMNPVFLTITAVTALVAGIATLTAVMGDNVEEYDTWTAATQRNYDELKALESEYDNAVEMYGETSAEASRLKYEVDQLSESFEANKQTVEELWAECDATVESSKKLVEEYEETDKALHDNEIGTMALIQRLEDLATSTETTAGSQIEMEAIILELNNTVSGLNLSYEDLIENQEGAISSLKEYAKYQAEQERRQAQYDQYVKSIAEEAGIREELAKATEQQAAAQEKATAAAQAVDDYIADHWTDRGVAWDDNGRGLQKKKTAALDALDEANSRVDELNASLDEQLQKQEEIEAAWEGIGTEASLASDEEITATDAVSSAIATQKNTLDELAETYDKAYLAAYGSIEGQIGLFDSMKTETEQSVKEMQAALESQAEYLNLYAENLQKASEFGLSENLISSLSDGSAESAGQLDAIISKIEQLGGTTEGMSEAAQEFVNSFNESFSQVETAKETWAETVAKMETDFDAAMDAIGVDMVEAVNNMNMADEARANAIATMDAYIAGIKSKIGEVNSATAAVKWANLNLNSFSPNGYAVGTTDAEPGLALVGEEGPELVNFAGGETVYTADETAKILSNNSARPEFYVDPENTAESSEVAVDKTITLKLEGAGELKVGGSGVRKEDIVDVLVENVKDILMNIIHQEILEEGELSYDY